jgi:hypothetical protein
MKIGTKNGEITAFFLFGTLCRWHLAQSGLRKELEKKVHLTFVQLHFP